jgi:DnaK suppressor protein
MNKTDIEARLQRKLLTLQHRLKNITADVTKEHSCDFAEQAQERANDEVIDAIGNETRNTIRHIHSALRRLEGGQYGICESCGDDIDRKRLEVLPEATHCTLCGR